MFTKKVFKKKANPKYKMEQNMSIEEHVKDLENAIEAQKLFKKENKELFLANREHTKIVNSMKDKLKSAMAESGVNKVTVGNTEVEIKRDVKVKHNPELIETMIADDGKFEEYMTKIQEPSDTIVARKAKKPRTN